MIAAYEDDERAAIVAESRTGLTSVPAHEYPHVDALPNIVELCLGMAARPIVRRLSTGIQTIDASTRGGIPEGRIIVISGAPGAAKTALAVQCACVWSRGRARVVYLAADQSPEAILERVGQHEGLARDDLEGATDANARSDAWHALAARVRDLAMTIVDGADVTVESSITALRAMPGDTPAVLILDSIQTVRCAEADRAETPRARMDAVIAVLRGAARSGIIVIAVSEMQRGAYSYGDRSSTVALAAAKESGAIEYAADLLLALRCVAGEADMIDAEIAKCRLGPKGALRLRLDHASGALTETDRPPTDARGSTPPSRRDQATLGARILAAVRAEPLPSASAVHAHLRAQGRGARKETVLAEVRAMLADARLVLVGGRLRPSGGSAVLDLRPVDDAAVPAVPGTAGAGSTVPAPRKGAEPEPGTDDRESTSDVRGAIVAALAPGSAASLDAVRLRIVNAARAAGHRAPPAWMIRATFVEMADQGEVVRVGEGHAASWALAPSPDAPLASTAGGAPS